MRTVLAAALIATAAGAQARTADCLVRVDGLTVIDGPCEFTGIDGDGSFAVATLDGGYFAQVLVTRAGQAEGYWNEERWSGHAHTPLGVLVRDDACWSNGLATVCAW